MSNRDKKLLVIIIALVAMLAVVLIGVFVYAGNEDEGRKPQNSGNEIIISESESSDKQSENSEVPPHNNDILTEGVEIETPAGKVFYPGEWEEYIMIENVSEDGGESIKFYANIEGKEKIHLFDFNFGIAKGSRLGSVKVNGQNVDLYFEVFETEFDDSWSDEEKNIVYSMQEGLNNVAAQFTIDTSVSEAVKPSENKINIETPYGTINFPGEWEEYLATEIDKSGDYTVKFYADVAGKRFSLFDFSFGKESDSSLGKVTAKDGSEAWLNLTVHEFIPDEGVTSETADIVYGMQEAFNDIVEDLID